MKTLRWKKSHIRNQSNLRAIHHESRLRRNNHLLHSTKTQMDMALQAAPCLIDTRASHNRHNDKSRYPRNPHWRCTLISKLNRAVNYRPWGIKEQTICKYKESIQDFIAWYLDHSNQNLYHQSSSPKTMHSLLFHSTSKDNSAHKTKHPTPNAPES